MLINSYFALLRSLFLVASFGVTQLPVSSLELLSFMLDGLRLIILFIPYHLAVSAVHTVTFQDVIPCWDSPFGFVKSYMPVEFLLFSGMVAECHELDP